MSSAAEARFRVQTPNSRPRAVKVIGLDTAGGEVVERLGDGDWQHATLLTAAPDGSLRDRSGRTRMVRDEIAGADLVVLVAGPGGRAHAAAIIGDACSRRRVMTTGFLVGAANAPERELSKTLVQLRPWSLMVVIARNDDYIDDMMTALRA
jgi:hypothetical protein